MVVLAIGLLSVAAQIAATMEAGTRSRYMSMASILASEKLDSLNKYPSGELTVTTATTQYETGTAESTDPTDANLWPGGALSSTPCATTDQWCDEVTVSESSGADYETQTQMVMNPGSNPPTFSPVTATIVHTNTGCVGTPAACGVPGPGAGTAATFTRRWLITSGPTITSVAGASVTANGVRRITVIVTKNINVFSTPVSFQISMVRP